MTKGGCLLYIDGKVICFVATREEAQTIAEQHTVRAPALRIECFASGEPVRSWQYHHPTQRWVEQPAFR